MLSQRGGLVGGAIIKNKGWDVWAGFSDALDDVANGGLIIVCGDHDERPGFAASR